MEKKNFDMRSLIEDVGFKTNVKWNCWTKCYVVSCFGSKQCYSYKGNLLDISKERLLRVLYKERRRKDCSWEEVCKDVEPLVYLWWGWKSVKTPMSVREVVLPRTPVFFFLLLILQLLYEFSIVLWIFKVNKSKRTGSRTYCGNQTHTFVVCIRWMVI